MINYDDEFEHDLCLIPEKEFDGTSAGQSAQSAAPSQPQGREMSADEAIELAVKYYDAGILFIHDVPGKSSEPQ